MITLIAAGIVAAGVAGAGIAMAIATAEGSENAAEATKYSADQAATSQVDTEKLRTDAQNYETQLSKESDDLDRAQSEKWGEIDRKDSQDWFAELDNEMAVDLEETQTYGKGSQSYDYSLPEPVSLG